MDSTEVGILEQSHKISLGSFLKSRHSTRLKAEVSFIILCYFTNQPLKGKLANEKLGALLIFPNFTESDCSRSEAMGLFHTSSLNRLTGSLVSNLLAGSFTSSRLTCSLLRASHREFVLWC